MLSVRLHSQNPILGRRQSATRVSPTRRQNVKGLTPQCATHNPADASFFQSCMKTAGTVLLAACMSLWSPQSVEALEDGSLTVPMARSQELFSIQRIMVEAWTIIHETYVDSTFNHRDWEKELKNHLLTVSQQETVSQGQGALKDLISTLSDPYTRWVSEKEYQDFRVDSDGEIQGVGLLIASDPQSGRVYVLSPIKGSPAEKAGLRPGDEVISVNGSFMQGWDGEAAAQALRGKQGSSVDVEIARPYVPGEVGGKLDEDARIQHKKFRLRRERVTLSPVFATALHTDDEHTYGYIRLVNFSQKSADEMKKAVKQLIKDGSEGFIMDLRNNPGGLVTSALDVADLWLDGAEHPTIFSISGRDASDSEQIHLVRGHALTHLPLTVLINKQTASASEILAGALKDNGRADVIGPENSFGKGKIQSVFELSDGSALVVTVAQYQSPKGYVIDKIGIAPSLSCSVPDVDTQTRAGIPVGPGLSGVDSTILEELEHDSCVQTAESDLSSKMSAKMLTV
jgi:carboxyl-terminal processing protease